ncbi:MAG: type VI secretion system ATPase TssH, partial [Candidatus Omnitrophota bacterium]
IGSELIRDLDDKSEIKNRINDELRGNFRPEFLNRVDETVIFNRLKKENIHQIVDIQLELFRSRLREKDITVEVTEKAKNLLSERGYDLVYGARPLKRVIQKLIQDPMAMKLLKGEIKEHDKVIINADKEGELVFGS